MNHLASVLMALLLWYCPISLNSQKRPYAEVLSELESASGLARAKLLIELCNQDIYSDQELARRRAKEAFMISEATGNKYGLGWGLRYIGLSFFFEGRLDSAKVYYERCAPYFEAPKDKGWSFYNIASIYENQGAYDSAHYYLAIAEDYFLKDEAFIELGAVAMMKGNINCFKGNFNKALPLFLTAKDFFESANDLLRKADAITELGNANAKLENYELCIEYLKEASLIYKSQNDPYYNSKVLNYIGYYLLELDHKDSAVDYLNRALQLSKEVKHHLITGNSLRDLATVDIEKR